MSDLMTITEWGWSDAVDEAAGLGPSAWIDSSDLVGPEPLLDEDGEPILHPEFYARKQAARYGGRAYRRKVTSWTPIGGDNHVE